MYNCAKLFFPVIFTLCVVGCQPGSEKSPTGAQQKPSGTEDIKISPEKSGKSDDCLSKCIQSNMMRAVSAEQIESDCRISCRK